jgi:anti-sigma factor RsiW
MCEKELLVSYLYDDLADADRARFETHLRGCAECRDEVSALRNVRADLVTWAPSQPELGFRIVRGPQPVPNIQAPAADVRWPPPNAWRAWWTPAAGLAAAAVLVLAAASAIAHVEVRRGPDGITVRSGWGASAPSASAPASGGSFGATSPSSARASGGNVGGSSAATAAETSVPSAKTASAADAALDPALLAAIERRLRALETSRDMNVRAASMSARSDEEILRRVRDLLAQSETKQYGELALRISQVMRDVDAQRTADLNRIQQRLGRIDASVNAEAAAHGELTNYVLTAVKQK